MNATYTLVDTKTGNQVDVNAPVGLDKDALRTALLCDASVQEQAIAALGRPISWVTVMRKDAAAGTGVLPVTLMANASITTGDAAAEQCKAAANRAANPPPPTVNVPGAPVPLRNTRTPAAPATPQDRKQALMAGGMTDAEAAAFLRGKWQAAQDGLDVLADTDEVATYRETLVNLAQAQQDLAAIQTLIQERTALIATLATCETVVAYKDLESQARQYAAYAPAIMSSSDGF